MRQDQNRMICDGVNCHCLPWKRMHLMLNLTTCTFLRMADILTNKSATCRRSHFFEFASGSFCFTLQAYFLPSARSCKQSRLGSANNVRLPWKQTEDVTKMKFICVNPPAGSFSFRWSGSFSLTVHFGHNRRTIDFSCSLTANSRPAVTTYWQSSVIVRLFLLGCSAHKFFWP